MNLILNLSKTGIREEEIFAYSASIADAEKSLKLGKEGFNGWLRLPEEYDSEELDNLRRTAYEISEKCEVLIVIGIGGSYLGAKACIEMMGNSFQQMKNNREGRPIVLFAGHNISAEYHSELIDVVKDKEICLCVISKSGTTTEPDIAFAVLKKLIYDKYGEAEAKKRIFTITDKEKGTLIEESKKFGYKSFVIPSDVGGRYSVLTPVGLLPIAVAGIDIEEVIAGACDGAVEYDSADLEKNICNRYAVARDILDRKGKKIEIFEAYEPKLYYFGEWLIQLFGESEGKNGKGIFPSQLQFTTDLHSMGQFIQEGNPIFFETVLNVLTSEKDVIIPETAAAQFRGKTMSQVNYAAFRGVVAAHFEDKIPVILLDIPKISPYYFGKMVYFFEKSCALRSYLIGVNPFNQPGVEKYKAYMKEALNDQF